MCYYAKYFEFRIHMLNLSIMCANLQTEGQLILAQATMLYWASVEVHWWEILWLITEMDRHKTLLLRCTARTHHRHQVSQ